MTTTITKSKLEFNPTRLIIIGKIIVGLLWLVLVGILMGGSDSFGVPRREFVIVNGGASFLLFPGSNVTAVLDAFYLIAACMFLFFTIAMMIPAYASYLIYKDCDKTYDYKGQKDSAETNRKMFWVVVFFPLYQLCFHLLGNFHYQAYGAMKVIPPENVFWMFDYRSFFVGIGTLIPIGIFLGLCGVIIYVIYYVVSGRLCFDRVEVNVTEV